MASSSASPSASHLAVVCAVESLTAVPESDHLAVAVLHVATASGESQERRVVVKRSELQPGELCVFVAAGSFVLRHKAFSKAADNFYQVLRKRIAGVQSEGMVLSLSVLEDASIQSASSVGFPAFEDSEARKPDEVKAGTDVSEWLRVRERLALGAGDLGAVVELVEQELAGSTYLLERAGRMCGEVLERMKGGEAAEWEDGTAERLGRVVELHGRLPKYLQRRLCKAALRLLGRAGDRAVPVLEHLLGFEDRTRPETRSLLCQMLLSVQEVVEGRVVFYNEKEGAAFQGRIRERRLLRRSRVIVAELQEIVRRLVDHPDIGALAIASPTLALATPRREEDEELYTANAKILTELCFASGAHAMYYNLVPAARSNICLNCIIGLDAFQIFSGRCLAKLSYPDAHVAMDLAPIWWRSDAAPVLALKVLDKLSEERTFTNDIWIVNHAATKIGKKVNPKTECYSGAVLPVATLALASLNSVESTRQGEVAAAKIHEVRRGEDLLTFLKRFLGHDFQLLWKICFCIVAAKPLNLDLAFFAEYVERVLEIHNPATQAERDVLLMLGELREAFSETMVKSAAKLH